MNRAFSVSAWPGGSVNANGRTGSVLLLMFTAAASSIAADNSTPIPPAKLTIERGLQFLQKEAFHWKETRKCAACHHAATMIWTFNEARAAGYSVNEKALTEITEWAFDMKTNSLTLQPPPRDLINLGWPYLLLSTETAPAFKPSSHTIEESEHNPASTNDDSIPTGTQTFVRLIVGTQAADGSWGRPLDERIPLGGPPEDIAILSRLALLQSGDRSAPTTNCINKALVWLAANHDNKSRQARNLRLLMGAYEHKPAAELAPAIASIRSEQNADGGWGQTPEMPSDAYATGQALYVLARAGVPRHAAEMERGAEFLRRTQNEEGFWTMTSRVHAKNVNPITVAGTAWAVLGLLRAEH